MSGLAVLGAGAFGTSLAIALSRDSSPVSLWSRSTDAASAMNSGRVSGQRLPGYPLPASLRATSNLSDLSADICLITVPTQSLPAFLAEYSSVLDGRSLVACCKGIDLETGMGPTGTLQAACPNSPTAILTGPSFAVDIAAGSPTALVLASAQDYVAKNLQTRLGRNSLRLYRTTDVVGAELGGALKNIIALAAGITIGAGLGDSARAAVISRGFAEMTRFALAKNAKLETLFGLSGLGDLILTSTSEKSRNFLAGRHLGQGRSPNSSTTVEGISSAQAIAKIADRDAIDMPLSQMVMRVTTGQTSVRDAVDILLARPVGTE